MRRGAGFGTLILTGALASFAPAFYGEAVVVANPFRAARGYLGYSPLSQGSALLASILAAAILPTILPLLYLFTDLIVYRGQMPTYGGAGPAVQAAFRSEWESGLSTQPAVAERLARTRPAVAASYAPAAEWEWRWQATTAAALDASVGPEAAEAYLPPPDASGFAHPTHAPLGLLATVARERGSWRAAPLAVVARILPGTWKPSDSFFSANAVLLTILLGLSILIVMTRAVLLNVASYATTSCITAAVVRLRRAMFNHSQRLSAVAIKREAQGEAAELITTRVEHVQDGLYAWLGTAPQTPVVVLIVLAILLSVNPWVSLAILCAGGFVWLVAGQFTAWAHRGARIAARRAESRLGLLRESLSVMQLIKAYLMERFSQTRVERHLAELSRAAWKRQRDTASRPTFFAAVGLTAAGLLYLCGWVILGGSMSVAGLAVKVAGVAILVAALSRWLSARTRIVRARGAAADIFEFLDRRPDAGQPLDVEFLQPMAKRLDFVEISLREPGTGRMILENVTFAIPAGSRAAIVYADPSEAHAVAYLIARFLDPTGGEVRIDGKNVRWVTYESLRTQAALVLEQSLVFSDTVANNIGCGDPSFSLPQIIEAAKLAHAHQFVQHLAHGYETKIGDGGASLKIGEKYRIALARAILRDPSLIVLEEPGATLDPDSAALIDDALARIQAGRTILYLARRPSTVRTADRVFVLQHGKLVAAGKHDDLLANSEMYRLLHFKQSLTGSGA